MNRNNKELITKRDYELLGAKENATSKEINVAYEKLIKEYHPEKIKLEKLREPDEVELKKYQEIEKVYKKFEVNGRVERWKYKCCGWKGDGPCTNEFYPCLWEKIEDGHSRLFCSQECYNSKFEFPRDKEREGKVDEINRKMEEWKQQKFQERKVNLAQAKTRKIEFLKKQLEWAKVKPEELEPTNRNFEQEINNVTVQNVDDDEATIRLYDIGDRIEKDIYSKKKKEKIYCDNCGKEIEQYREPGTNHTFAGIGSVDSDGNRRTFCSEECSSRWHDKKGKFTIKKNAFSELLKWMEKEGITNISLDPNSKKIAVEYGKGNQKTIEDDNLTSEQREIKNLLQRIGKNSLSQQELRVEVKGKDKGGDNNLLKPAIGIGIVALVIILIGVVVYNKNKKKGY